ncbi:MAG TPA: hypothetical protein DCL35_07290 [Candidatus Omnitrophica bacterium]|nr:hypothetical protein [Candidatus Omnitrophota bacterium]
MYKNEYPKTIQNLREFKNLFVEFAQLTEKVKLASHNDEKSAMEFIGLREKINNKIPVIKYYFDEAGESYTYALAGRTISLFEDMLNPTIYSILTSFGGFLLTIDAVDRCIGFYNHLVETKKTIVDFKVTPIVDIINLIKRNLRKAFKTEPKNESEVQDCVELILNVANVNHSKEKESFEYSSKSYIPDFVIKDLETVIEIKLCNSKDDESSIIGEINDDILAYRTRYKILIFIVYDVGIIRDEDKFKNYLKDASGVYIEVVKH